MLLIGHIFYIDRSYTCSGYVGYYILTIIIFIMLIIIITSIGFIMIIIMIIVLIFQISYINCLIISELQKQPPKQVTHIWGFLFWGSVSVPDSVGGSNTSQRSNVECPRGATEGTGKYHLSQYHLVMHESD